MLVIAQRWVTGTPAEDFGRQVVEALVIVQEEPEALPWAIYSAFYDPTQGQTLAAPFHWWRRHASGLMPGLVSFVLEILAQWQLPPDEATQLQDLVERLERTEREMRGLLQR